MENKAYKIIGNEPIATSKLNIIPVKEFWTDDVKDNVTKLIDSRTRGFKNLTVIN